MAKWFGAGSASEGTGTPAADGGDQSGTGTGAARNRLMHHEAPSGTGGKFKHADDETMRKEYAAARAQLKAEGVPDAELDTATQALIGQAIAESGGNPNTVHDKGTGYGIYGARLDRRDKMLTWLAENKYAKNSPEGQAKYMAHEAMTRYPTVARALRGHGTARQKGWITENIFENPLVKNNRNSAIDDAARYKDAAPPPMPDNLMPAKPKKKGDDWAPLARPKDPKTSSLYGHHGNFQVAMQTAPGGNAIDRAISSTSVTGMGQ